VSSSRQRILLLLGAMSPLLLLACLVGRAAGAWIFAALSGLFPVALIALGAVRSAAGLGRLRAPLLLLAVVLAGGLLALLALPPGGATVFALPLRTALMLFVLVPVPLAIVGWAYAATFSDFWLRDEDLERLRRWKRAGGPPGEGR
jgi:hypothetical protein